MRAIGASRRIVVLVFVAQGTLIGVLADEPTGNLDMDSADQVMDLIAAINRDEGTTFLISTHDGSIAARCQRQISIRDGLATG